MTTFIESHSTLHSRAALLSQRTTLVAALAVIVKDPKHRARLAEDDPLALEQAEKALKDAGVTS